jgi:LacI family transcriptional regulator
MSVTLKDIAHAVQVSQMTVSKVLRGTGKISPGTRQRVLVAARQMRYRPNALAQSMRQGRSGLIGFVYTAEGVRGNLPPQLITQIERELRSRSYGLLLSEVSDPKLAEPGVASALMRHWMADGLLINHQIELVPGVAERVEQDRVPAIWINSKQSANCVYFDDYGAARRATEHLLALGHTRIAYADYSHPSRMLTGPAEHYSVVDRHAGYRAALVDAGLSPCVIVGGETAVPINERFAFSRPWLEASDRPTAIIAYGLTTLTPILLAAVSLGLSVPRDLSLINFSQTTDTLMDLAVTTMHTESRHLATAAVRELFARLESTEPGERHREGVAVRVELFPGESCAPSLVR